LDETLLKSRTILLTSDINANSTKQVVGSFILLNEQDAHTPIELYVRTNGGYYDDAFAIIDVMRTIDAPVNTYAIGGCYSAGAIIVASGTGTRAVYANALLMVHDNLSEDGSRYSNDTKENQRMHTFWAAFKQLPKTWFTKVTDEANYITAEEALEFDLVDMILRSE
jgi:ATP-dependent Clp protease protease subunit